MHLRSACQTLWSNHNLSILSCKPSFPQKNKKSKIFSSRLRSINSHLRTGLFSTPDLDRTVSSSCIDGFMIMTQMIMISLRLLLLVAIIAVIAFKLLIRALEQMVPILELLKASLTQSLMSSSAVLSALARFRTLSCVPTAPSSPAALAWESGSKRQDLNVLTAGLPSGQTSWFPAASSPMWCNWYSSKRASPSRERRSSALSTTPHSATTARLARCPSAVTVASSETSTNRTSSRNWARYTRSTSIWSEARPVAWVAGSVTSKTISAKCRARLRKFKRQSKIVWKNLTLSSKIYRLNLLLRQTTNLQH